MIHLSGYPDVALVGEIWGRPAPLWFEADGSFWGRLVSLAGEVAADAPVHLEHLPTASPATVKSLSARLAEMGYRRVVVREMGVIDYQI